GIAAEADSLPADPASNDVVESDEGAAANEKNVGGVDLDILLLGVFAPTLRRNVANGSFQHFEEGLLDAFAADVAGDADVLAGLCDLFDLVDINDSALSGLDVKVRGMEEFEKQVLDVLADIAGLGEGGGVADGEGHIENSGQGAGQERLAASGRADEQDVT